MSRILRIAVVVTAAVGAPYAASAAEPPVPPPLPLALQAAAQRADGPETWSRTFKTGPQGAFELWNLTGDVTITAGSGDTIQVKAIKRLHRGAEGARASDLDRIEIVANETAGHVRIRTNFPDMKRVAAEVVFHVLVPPATAVTVQTVSGSISLQRVTGDTTLESVSGDIAVEAAQRLVRAKTVSGNVTLNDAAGDAIEANSVSGDVRLRGLKARGCTLQTVSGDVVASGAACARAELKSVSGDVEYSGALAPGGRYDFKSHSGDIRLTVGGGSGFVLTASTFSGDLSSQLALANVTKSEPPRHGPRTQRLQGTYGDGSAQIVVTTFSGSVVLADR